MPDNVISRRRFLAVLGAAVVAPAAVAKAFEPKPNGLYARVSHEELLHRVGVYNDTPKPGWWSGVDDGLLVWGRILEDGTFTMDGELRWSSSTGAERGLKPEWRAAI